MNNYTAAVKILESKALEIKQLCQNRGISHSEFFRQTVEKAVNRPYNGPRGITKCLFSQKIGGKNGLLQKRRKTVMIGARITPELKAKVLGICERYKLTESTFYRSAIDELLSEAKKTREHKLVTTPLLGKYRINESAKLSHVVISINNMQQNHLKTRWETEMLCTAAGLFLALFAPAN